MVTSSNNITRIDHRKKCIPPISGVDKVTSFVADLTWKIWSMEWVDMQSTLACYNTIEEYKWFKDKIDPNVCAELSKFMHDKWWFCLDIWCWYMQVGRKFAKDFWVQYIWIDIVDHPKWLVFLSNPDTLPPLWAGEYFVHMDIFSGLRKIPEWSVPMVLLNNFDESTFLVPWYDYYDISPMSNKFESLLYAEVDRILMPWGYLLALGTTIPFSAELFPEKFKRYKTHLSERQGPLFQKQD